MNNFDRLQLAMFSGKGGVGKTTLSCAFSRYWAQQYPTQQILLLSTDPAHSLADVLQMSVEDVPHPVEDLPNLQVRALDAEKLLKTFRGQYGQVLELLVERGSFVQGEDLSPIWDLSWPGLDELMGVLEIQRILRDQEADRVVVDMAPSGHTLNLFGLMDFLDRFLGALALFQEKHRVVSQSFTGRYSADAADVFLTTMKTDLVNGRCLLQDVYRTACLVVAIAEPMSYLETRRFLEALIQLQIPFGGLFVNRLQPTDAVTIEQQEMVQKFLSLAEPQPVMAVPLQAHEPVGVRALDRLFNQVEVATVHVEQAPVHVSTPVFAEKIFPGFSDFIDEGRRLILVGGKGGVGKTTISAAIGWGMAERHPDHQVRVISIDPAHSLGDALGIRLGHVPTTLTSNLSGQEIDATQVLDQFREKYLWELAAMMSGETGDPSMQIAYGPEAWQQIVTHALPGIDEMLSLIAVIDLLETEKQDLIVLDTAPTGHLLRFLEMPTALSDWLTWIFKLWMKYQDVAGHTELISRLRTLRQQVIQAQKKLKDPKHTEFIGVVQAQTAIVAETERLCHSLANMGISQRYIVHNRFQPGKELPANTFQQTIVHLSELPRGIPALTQIQGTAKLLF